MLKPARRVCALVLVLMAAFPGLAGAASQVTSTNSSRGTASATGPAIGANVSAFRTSPTAIAAVSASAQQTGDTRVRVRQSTELASGDVVAGSQVQGHVGDTEVMASNSAIASFGFSGPVAAANVALGSAGPLAVSVLLEAQASQFGNNDVDVSQSLVAASGDAVVGSQVTGIVADDDASISKQNSALLSVAVSGIIVAANITPLPVLAGPLAVGLTVGGAASPLSGARASQVGDNAVNVAQAADSDSGDGVAAGQISGVIGGGTEVEIAASNSAVAALGASGTVASDNTAAAIVGPNALSDVRSSAQQSGSNSASVVQATDALSGDAVGGAEVTGVVAGADADIDIMLQQDAFFTAAATLTATATNTATVLAGPAAVGLTVPESVFAQATQFGSNAVGLAQESAAATGNALTSSQTTGAVAGDGAEIDISAQNGTGVSIALGLSGGAIAGSQTTGAVGGDDSDITLMTGNRAANLSLSLAIAFASGAANAATVTAGPAAVAVVSADASQFGDDTIDADQVTNDANTAALTAGPTAIAGTAAAPLARASASQTGADRVGLNQEAASASGDSLAASQVAGVTAGTGSDATVSQTNTAIAALALSGDIPVTNTATVAAGPAALAGPSATGLEFALAQQSGAATADVEQSIDASTGDALGGAQVTGVAGPQDARVSVSNSAVLVPALSGTPTATNTATGVLGPVAVAALTAGSTGAVVTDLDLGQTFVTDSGDAVSGGQVTGRA